jgi:hypothetical protein
MFDIAGFEYAGGKERGGLGTDIKFQQGLRICNEKEEDAAAAAADDNNNNNISTGALGYLTHALCKLD